MDASEMLKRLLGLGSPEEWAKRKLKKKKKKVQPKR
jgi:hypothetical protein